MMKQKLKKKIQIKDHVVGEKAQGKTQKKNTYIMKCGLNFFRAFSSLHLLSLTIFRHVVINAIKVVS